MLQGEIDRHELRVESKSYLNAFIGLQKHIDSIGVSGLTYRTEIAVAQENIRLKE